MTTNEETIEEVLIPDKVLSWEEYESHRMWINMHCQLIHKDPTIYATDNSDS